MINMFDHVHCPVWLIDLTKNDYLVWQGRLTIRLRDLTRYNDYLVWQGRLTIRLTDLTKKDYLAWQGRLTIRLS